MREVVFKPAFEDWRCIARSLAYQGVPPNEIVWRAAEEARELGIFTRGEIPAVEAGGAVRVPSRFLELAEAASLHSAPERWALLYRVLWRLSHGEPKLLELGCDEDVHKLISLDRQVRKDAYRMRAFARFNEVNEGGSSWFVAWYEPEHDSMGLNASFFRERFTNMRWSILTPRGCMHWNGQELRFTRGASKELAGKPEEAEKLWVTYYCSIFNPARLNATAMQAQLLKRNWKNLPEARVIEKLIREAPGRAARMIQAGNPRQTPIEE